MSSFVTTKGGKPSEGDEEIEESETETESSSVGSTSDSDSDDISNVDSDEESDQSDSDDDMDGDEDEPVKIFNKKKDVAKKDAIPTYDMNNPHNEDEENDDSSVESNEENYLQKFSEDVRKTVIADCHPHLKALSCEEIDVLCRIVRDDMGNIIDPLHRTNPFITKYEMTRVLGERALQISNGAEPLIEIDNTIIDEYLIASMEFAAKKIPFIIARPIPNSGAEYWKLRDLEVLL